MRSLAVCQVQSIRILLEAAFDKRGLLLLVLPKPRK